MTQQFYTIQTSDDKTFQVEDRVCKMSVTIQNMIDDLGESEVPIPLNNVDSATFQKVLEFCNAHVDVPPTIFEKNATTSDLSPADAEFINVSTDVLLQLIYASNYLDIKSLMTICCIKVASLIKGKTIQQMRDVFGIEGRGGFTEEEEKQIILENSWCEEIQD